MTKLAFGEERRGRASDSATGEVLDHYDPDRISALDLMELGITAADADLDEPEGHVAEDVRGTSNDWPAPTPDMMNHSANGATAGEETVPHADNAPSLVDEGCSCAVPDGNDAKPGLEAPMTRRELLGTSQPDTGEVYALEIQKLYEEAQPAPDDPLDLLWHLEIPEADDKEVDREVARSGVSSGERAVQLALGFLRQEGLYSERSLDLLVDIIQQRGWSGVQTQVRGLVRAGYDIAQIHRIFQLTDAWLHCVESDVLAPEYWHNNKRLTWLEAAHLLDFLGYDAEFDQISDFLFAEQEVWFRLHREAGHLSTFKSYLFQYRLSPRTELDEAGWQSNLDPGDTRSFDGTRNQLYSSSWWDEPTDSGARNVRQMFGAIYDPARIAEWLSPDAEEMF